MGHAFSPPFPRSPSFRRLPGEPTFMPPSLHIPCFRGAFPRKGTQRLRSTGQGKRACLGVLPMPRPRGTIHRPLNKKARCFFRQPIGICTPPICQPTEHHRAHPARGTAFRHTVVAMTAGETALLWMYPWFSTRDNPAPQPLLGTLGNA